MKPIRLRKLWLSHSMNWSLSFVLGLLTLVASVLLLAFSGWFLSASALAGLTAVWAGNFDFLRPGALIRLLAIVRTSGRYFERLTSHALVLRLLSTLRVESFQALAQQSFQQVQQGFSGDKLQRLLGDIDVLDQFPLQVVNRLGWALALGAGYSIALALLLPAALNLMLPLLLLMLLLPLLAQRGAFEQAGMLVELQAKRRQHLLQSLTLLTPYLLLNRGADLLHQQQQHDQALYALEHQLQRRQLRLQAAMWMLLLAGIVSLVVAATPALQSSPALATQTQPASGSPSQVRAEQQPTHAATPHLEPSPALLANVGHTPTVPYQHQAPVVIALLLGWLGLAEVLLPLVLLPAIIGQTRQARNRLNQLRDPASGDTPDQATVHDGHQGARSGFGSQSTIAQQPLSTALQLVLTDVRWGFAAPLPVAPLSAVLQAGSCVLLQGPSGVGKSALLQTIAGELPCHGGTINYQSAQLSTFAATRDDPPTTAVGVDFSAPQHRTLCCYVGQRAQVFGLTIAADLRLANPKASDDELQHVLALVGLSSWLTRQPQGLLTVLGHYGVGLSGGELRRFALARSLLRQAPVLLLDEPFAGLDSASAESLLQNLIRYQRHGILVIASHQQLTSPFFNHHWTLARLVH